MTCNEAAEFVSALCDGERIPREAAQHLGICQDCRARLNDYMQMGLELRRVANAAEPETVPNISWNKQERMKTNWWQLGREPMRISRLAFVLMLVAIGILSTGIVLVRARESQGWFVFQMKFQKNTIATEQSISELKSKANGLEMIQHMPDGGLLAYAIRVLDSKEGAVQIGIRAQRFPSSANKGHSVLALLAQVHNAPEKVHWYIPEHKVRIPVEGYESVEITGELLNAKPVATNPTAQPYLPKEGDLRLMSPVLLRENRLLVNWNGATGISSSSEYGVGFGIPGEGLFLFSLNHFDDAIAGKLSHSEVEFTLDGRPYLLLAGAPITAEGKTEIWVAHLPNSKSTGLGPWKLSELPQPSHQ